MNAYTVELRRLRSDNCCFEPIKTRQKIFDTHGSCTHSNHSDKNRARASTRSHLKEAEKMDPPWTILDQGSTELNRPVACNFHDIGDSRQMIREPGHYDFLDGPVSLIYEGLLFYILSQEVCTVLSFCAFLLCHSLIASPQFWLPVLLSLPRVILKSAFRMAALREKY